MATRITYDGRSLPGAVTVTCDDVSDWQHFMAQVAIVRHRSAMPEESVVMLIKWAETGKLPPASPESLDGRKKALAREVLAEVMKRLDLEQ